MSVAIITPKIGNAILASVDRGNEKLQATNSLYDQMIKKFEIISQWPGGHTERLLNGYLRGKRAVVSLRNQDGWIKLFLIVNGRTQYTNSFVVGYYDLKTCKWTQSRSCTLQQFNIWHNRTKRDIGRLEDRGRL